MRCSYKSCIWLAACLCSALIGFYIGAGWYPFSNEASSTSSSTANLIALERLKTMQTLHRVTKLLLAGHRYARSSKTMKTLQQAYLLLTSFLKGDRNQTEFDVRPWRIRSESIPLTSVCPKVYKGMKHGYPFYYTGYDVEDCGYNRSISDLVTIVTDVRFLNHSWISKVVAFILKEHPDIPIILATSTSMRPSVFGRSVVSVTVNSTASDGSVWNRLIAMVVTPYTLIGRSGGFVFFDDNSGLERLIRMVEYTDASVVGGSHRNSSGHWKIGCYQMAMRNYAFRLVEGYDLSYNSCIYCDYISGPILARTKAFQNAFAENLNGDLVFVDYFWKNIGITAAVCPDAMFFTERLSLLESARREFWLPFVEKWELNKVVMPDQTTHTFTCSEIKASMRKEKGMSTQPCYLEELSDMLKYLFTVCEDQKIECEVQSGTQVGAVKFYGTLPWEMDSDLNYLGWNHTIIKSLNSTFKAAGYNLTDERVPNCNPVESNETVFCGYFGLRTTNWRIELIGTNQLATRRLSLKGVQVPTKVLIDGQWFPAYPNPALYARNQYGDDTFEHVEHYRKVGHESSQRYKTGSFLKCAQPGHHACLDQFLPVGNLQFLDVWL